MTKRELIVVSAFTGILLCDMVDLHSYIEEKLGRPVWTHELARHDIQAEIKEAARPEMLDICESAI